MWLITAVQNIFCQVKVIYFIVCVRQGHTTMQYSDRILINSRSLLIFFLHLKNLSLKFFSSSKSFCTFFIQQKLMFPKDHVQYLDARKPFLLLLVNSRSPFKQLVSVILEYIKNCISVSCKLEHFSCKVILASKKGKCVFQQLPKQHFQIA